MNDLVAINTKGTTIYLRASAVDAVCDAMDQKGTPIAGTCVAIVSGVMLPMQLTKESLLALLYPKVLNG